MSAERTGPVRTTLVVVFGGRSPEHDVSCSTARHVIGSVDPQRYAVTAVGIDRGGQWHSVDVTDLVGRPTAVGSGGVDDPGLAATGPVVEPAAAVGGIGSDAVVLPLLHGPFGEDGAMQGLLEMLDVAYVGSGVLGSALAMDKAMAKTVCAAAGIPQARHLVLMGSRSDGDLIARIEAAFGFPCFVKPANMGSSVGVSRVADATTLAAAVAEARRFDPVVVVEEAITGRELEVAVLGGDEPEAFGPGEVIADAEFYDYSAKYLSGGSRTVIPAEVPPGVAAAARRLALEAFDVLRCEGLARCDFFLADDGRGLLLNEVNTMPGFTPISMFPMMAIDGGVPYPAIIDRLVEIALLRHRRRGALAHRSSD
jgi:D-alanine-D-alanine ligase